MPVTRTLVRTTYLEIPTDAPLRPPSRPRPDYELRQAVAITPEFARFLYRGVGYPWNWTRRVGWSYAKWERDLADGRREYWVAYVTGTVAQRPHSETPAVVRRLTPQSPSAPTPKPGIDCARVDRRDS